MHAFYITTIKTNSVTFTYNFKRQKIEQVSTLKFLGVHVDEHLSWTKHAKYLLGKLRCGIDAITKVKSYLNTDTLLILYHSLINSHLQYCISNWCYGNVTITKKLEKTTNKIVPKIF